MFTVSKFGRWKSAAQTTALPIPFNLWNRKPASFPGKKTSSIHLTLHRVQGTGGVGQKASFSRMRSEGSRFTWGSGGEAVFAKFCVCVRKCPQVSATACGDAVRLSTVASVSGVVPKACQVESWCLCE